MDVFFWTADAFHAYKQANTADARRTARSFAVRFAVVAWHEVPSVGEDVEFENGSDILGKSHRITRVLKRLKAGEAHVIYEPSPPIVPRSNRKRAAEPA